MRILSWNIQAGLGPDNVISLERIANAIRACRYPDGGQADVICLQEVTRGFPDLTQGREIDQPAALEYLFPDHHAVFRPAVDLAPVGAATLARWQFGCMILSRHPVSQVFNHLLTQRGIGGKGMQRQALETIIEAPAGPLRIVTTHLEFNSPECRLNQAAQLKALQHEAVPGVPILRMTPYAAQPRPAGLILCGDFNLLADSPEYRMLVNNDPDTGAGLTDAWRRLHPNEPHAGTCGWADPAQWPQGPHCRDFFFVNHDAHTRLSWIGVDQEVRASDHQPVLLMLDTNTNPGDNT